MKFYLQGHPIRDTWEPPLVHVGDPDLPTGAFYNAGRSVLITSPDATEVLREHLERAGELLPLPYRDQVFTILNVTPCIDVLNHEQSEFRYGKRSGVRLGITRYAFHVDRFPRTSLFKIPEDRGSTIYVAEGANDFEMEFREAVRAAGLTGLIFRKIWDNEQELEFRGTPYGIWDFIRGTGDDE